MKTKCTAYISLGTNMGDKLENLKTALAKLNQQDIEIVKTSPVFETEPVGYTDQDYFYNIAIKVKTNLSPEKLLTILLETENQMGRERTIRFGPRIIDLDLLLYETVAIETDFLTLPHPRMFEREFITACLDSVLDKQSKYYPILLRTHSEEIKEIYSADIFNMYLTK